MNTKRIGIISILLAGLMLQLISPVTSATANVQLPEGDVPFYARIGSGENYHNSEWAVIIFYRPTECIPAGFNLLDFFDIPGAFGCGPQTTAGFAIWKNGPEIDPSPIHSKLFGLGAVPVWFVPWPALESAIAEGALYMSDLEGMAPLIGSASYYQETLHPSGSNHPSMGENVARGVLEDGRTFDVHSTVTETKMEPNTHIVFR
jgi:hypothetical protein